MILGIKIIIKMKRFAIITRNDDSKNTVDYNHKEPQAINIYINLIYPCNLYTQNKNESCLIYKIM